MVCGAFYPCNPHAAIERATRAAVDVVRVLNQQTWDSARVQAALARGVVCGDHDHEHDHAHLHTQGVGMLALRAETPMDLPRLTRWLQSLSTRRNHDLMRLKGILHCQAHDQAVVIQGVYQWLEVRLAAGAPPAASALVLIGRHLDAEALRRAWAECIARTCPA